MPFAILFIGALLVVVGYRGTHTDLLDLLKSDFTGSNNFIFWIISILVIGAVGYIPRLKPVSDGFLALVILVLFISNPGFFARFMEQVANPVPSMPKLKSGQSASGTPVWNFPLNTQWSATP